MAFINPFNFKKEESTENRSFDSSFFYGGTSFTSYFGANQKLTENEALSIPAVSSAIELITASVSQLPIYLYRVEDDNEVVVVKDDKRSFLLNNEPNYFMNAQTFKRQMVKDYLFYGASYIKIEKERNEITGLYTLPIEEISIEKYRVSPYEYQATIKVGYDGNSNISNNFSPDELAIVLKDSRDGFTGIGILEENADTLRLALDEIDYTNSILKNGALPIGVLKATARLSGKAIERLRNSWENLYGGSKKAGKTIILEEGLDYQPISMKPNELDLSNIKKQTISEIARIFNVPESMINSASNKYNSNEQNNIYFLQYCLAPILTAIESAYNKSLLLESEKEEGYFWKVDVSELLRTTERERIETVVTAMRSGLLSINEARRRIDMPNIDNDYFTWNLGNVFYDNETGKIMVPNTGVTIDPSDLSEKGFEENLNEDIDKDTEEENNDPLSTLETSLNKSSNKGVE